MGDNRYGDSQLGGLIGRCGPQDRLAAALHDRGCEHNAIRSIGKRWDRRLRVCRRARRQLKAEIVPISQTPPLVLGQY
jgi:hypothetical protein